MKPRTLTERAYIAALFALLLTFMNAPAALVGIGAAWVFFVIPRR